MNSIQELCFTWCYYWDMTSFISFSIWCNFCFGLVDTFDSLTLGLMEIFIIYSCDLHFLLISIQTRIGKTLEIKLWYSTAFITRMSNESRSNQLKSSYKYLLSAEWYFSCFLELFWTAARATCRLNFTKSDIECSTQFRIFDFEYFNESIWLQPGMASTNQLVH